MLPKLAKKLQLPHNVVLYLQELQVPLHPEARPEPMGVIDTMKWFQHHIPKHQYSK